MKTSIVFHYFVMEISFDRVLKALPMNHLLFFCILTPINHPWIGDGLLSVKVLPLKRNTSSELKHFVVEEMKNSQLDFICVANVVLGTFVTICLAFFFALRNG